MTESRKLDPFGEIERTQEALRESIEASQKLIEQSQELLARAKREKPDT